MMAVDDGKRFARLDRLFDVGVLGDCRILVVGCGSGGGSVALQLVMSGVKHFTLVDNDTLELENVVRHVCGGRFVGLPKVDAVAEVLKDRNPLVDVTKWQLDVTRDPKMEELVEQADALVLATDNEPSRWRINELCVRHGTPYCVARVFTRGIGGEVFAYRPGSGGCLACLEAVLQRTTYRSGIREVDLLTEQERDEMYGLAVTEIKDSPGLNVDISFITAFHTRYVLDSVARLLPARPKYLSEIPENYLIWGNRPIAPFEKNFQLQRMWLSPQTGCTVCGGVESKSAI